MPYSELGPVWAGSKVDWSSPLIPVQLYVELPFWLMMPEGTFDIKYEEATLKIEVVHGCEELQQTATHRKNGASTVFIARPTEDVPVRVQKLVDKSRNGYSARIHRTTLIIETSLHQNALTCATGTLQERKDSAMYLGAVAVGHLPFVNTLINAYRRAANDPFVMEVNQTNASIWFVRYQDKFLRVAEAAKKPARE